MGAAMGMFAQWITMPQGGEEGLEGWDLFDAFGLNEMWENSISGRYCHLLTCNYMLF